MKKLTEQKAEERTAAYARRKAAFGQGLDEAANAWLLGYLALHADAEAISGYMPMRTEISPLATMTVMHGQQKRICVPVIVGKDRPLEFREWTPDCEMVEGAFGALIPVGTGVLEPDLLITPLLAWDRKGYRLGYGGGFYDRTLEQLRAKRPTIAVGFAYSAQEVPRVPREATDQRLNALVTEKEIHFFDR
jgi:5-formyltetrahydrofolate cyclo-ligase